VSALISSLDKHAGAGDPMIRSAAEVLLERLPLGW
jgi:hypothetical protein